MRYMKNLCLATLIAFISPASMRAQAPIFRDRGVDDPFSSHDLEDILALVVSRDTVVSEFADSPEGVRSPIAKGFRWLNESKDYDALVAAHLNNAQDFKRVAETLRERIH